MGFLDKTFEKALKNIDVDALMDQINAKIQVELQRRGHAPVARWGSQGWKYTCEGCDFTANGNRSGDAGMTATQKMAEVHLEELKNVS